MHELCEFWITKVKKKRIAETGVSHFETLLEIFIFNSMVQKHNREVYTTKEELKDL